MTHTTTGYLSLVLAGLSLATGCFAAVATWAQVRAREAKRLKASFRAGGGRMPRGWGFGVDGRPTELDHRGLNGRTL